MRGPVTQIIAAAGLDGVVEAAPWVRDDGGRYARASIAHDTLDGAEGWRGDAYGVCGLSDTWTVTAKVESVTYPDFEAFDRDAYRLTLRRKLLDFGKWTLGAEVGPVYGTTATGFTGCNGFGLRRGEVSAIQARMTKDETSMPSRTPRRSGRKTGVSARAPSSDTAQISRNASS